MLASSSSLAKIPQSDNAIGQEASLEASENRDQAVMERAAELRRQGTVDSRQTALVLLEEHRLSLWDHPRYHREIALLYLDGKRYSNAYDSFSRVIELDPTNVPCRIDMVRILFWEMHRGDRRDELKDISRFLDESLQLLRMSLGVEPAPVGTEVDSVFTEDTDQTRLYRSALYLKSLALFEARFEEDSSALRDANSQKGRDLTEEIIRRFPNDQGSDALLMNALHCKDLGDLEASDYWFRQGIQFLGDRYRSQYLIPPQLASNNEFKKDGHRDKLIEQYWGDFADPVTGLNDIQLQYWYNLTVADIRFRDPFKDSVRGMDTLPGIMVARFGFPPSMEFRARGFIEGGVATTATDPTFYKDRPAKPMRPLVPRLQLHYPGLTLTFDYYHGGGWQPDTLTVVVLEHTSGPEVPPVLPIRDENAIERIYLSHAGARGTYSRGRELLLAAIPPWNDKSDWWEEAQVTLEVLSSQSLVVQREGRVVKADDVYEIAPGREVLLVGRDMELPEGHFTGYVTIRDGSGWRIGRSRIPMDVEVIRFRDLAVSELQMIVPETFGSERKLRRPERPYLPNPLGAVGSSGWFEVAYSIYNLDPNRDGDGLYEVTYTILPHDYRLAMERLRKRGALSQGEEPELGTIGHTIGDITLLEENFRQVKFPPSRVRGLVREGREIMARASVDASTLPSGMYVLQLRVRDVISDQETIREMSFRKVSDDVLDAMTLPEKR
jgi:tetratricopeptide (TPR) repeat protein